MRFRALLIVTIVAGIGLALAGGATAGTRTAARIYQAFKPNGMPAIHVTKTVKGHCYSGSLEADRNDAWRCFVGNFIYDPCFSSSNAKGIVLCPTAAWKQSGVKIKLTKALPKAFGDKPKPSKKSGIPWALETTSGLKCGLVTGATSVLDGRRANYECGVTGLLWGAPSRKSEPWTIYSATLSAKKLTKKVRIKIAWF
jgi:hypothetical protein